MTATALDELLLAMADDELVLGYWDSEWTGIAPMLEEDIAMSSLAQDEIGHAQALYRLRCDRTGEDPDELAYGRKPDGYRHARLLDSPRTDWGFTIARRYLYETADAERLAALARSSYAPLAELVAKLRREEVYHLAHVESWVRRLAAAGGEARDRLLAAFDGLWPDALTVLAPLDGDPELVSAGVLDAPSEVVRARWAEQIAPGLGEAGVPMPFAADRAGRLVPTVPASQPPRAGHSADFEWLWGELTMLRRADPEARW